MSASASASESRNDSHNIQASTQGASGNQSPTITAGGGVSYNDPQSLQDLISVVGDAIMSTLKGAGDVTQTALQTANAATAANQAQANNTASSDQNLVDAVLNANSQLATYQGSGGAIQQSQSTNYLIMAGAAVIGLVLLVLLGKRN